MMSSFLAAIATAPSAPVQRVLKNIATVFACNTLLDAPVSAYLPPKLKRATQHALEVALDTLRPDCVALVDAFDFPDSVLNSTIGRKDGNVYTPPPLASIPLLCSNDPPLTQVRGTV